MNLKHFEFDKHKNHYFLKEEELWQDALEVKLCFSKSENIEVYYGKRRILELKCSCDKYSDFQNLVFDLIDFWEQPPLVLKTRDENSEDVLFPSHLFMRHLFHDAHNILNNRRFIPSRDRTAGIYISLAFFNLILRKEELKEEIADFYPIIDFSREQVINEYSLGDRDYIIEYVCLLCQYWTRTFTEYEESFTNRDAEEEIWKILDKDYKEGDPDWYNLELDDFWYHSTDDGMRKEFFSMIEDINNWFSTKCYNVDAMINLFNKQRELEAKSDNKTTSSRIARFFKDNKIITGLKKQWDKRWEKFTLGWILIFILLGAFYPQIAKKWMLLFTVAGLCVSSIYFIIRYTMKDIYWFKKMIPRLFGCIIVGYLPLIMTDEMWTFCLKAQWYVSFIIFILGIGASLLYMSIEVNNMVHDKKRAWKRACQIIYIGLAESLIIGLVLCSLFVNVSSKLEKHASGDFFLDLVHVVYPSVVFTYFPLALFIGVFVQILWEDKPITEQL